MFSQPISQNSNDSKSTELSALPGTLSPAQAVASHDNSHLTNEGTSSHPRAHYLYNFYDWANLEADIPSLPLSKEEEEQQLEAFQARLVTLPDGAVTILKDKHLGRGAFGSVYEGLYQGERVAVKEFDPKCDLELTKAEALQAFDWETSRLSTLSHSNLVRFYGVCRDEAGTLFIVMELCQDQHLAKRLAPVAPVSQKSAINAYSLAYGLVREPSKEDKDTSPSLYGDDDDQAQDSGSSPYAAVEEPAPDKAPPPIRSLPMPDAPPLGWPLFWRIALDLAHALTYLHAQGALHRDFKSENVLFSLTGRAKLADLGVAQVDELVQSAEAKVVSRNLKDSGYAAPEEFKGKNSAKSDMFSYGIVLCEMLQGRTLSNRVKRRAGDLETIPEKCLSPIRALIEQCWQTDPEARPSAQEVIHQLEACYADCGVSLKDRLLPRLEQMLEAQQSALRQYIPSYIQETLEEPLEAPLSAPTIQDALQRFLGRKHSRVSAILGEGGLGKSLCTYQLVEQLLTAHRQDQHSWLPIFIRPGIAQWRHDALRDGLRTCLAYYGLSSSDIDGLRTQRLVFIFDGYDELSGNALSNLPATLGLADFPNAKLIISARPMPDLMSALPQKLGFEGNCIVHTLQPFTPEQRLAFLQKTMFWDALQQQWFAAQLAQAPDLTQSLQNPFVLHLFAQSWESQRKQNLATLKKHEIYATFIRHWVETNAAFLPPPLHQALLGDNPLESAQDWIIQNAFAMATQKTFSLESIKSPWTQPADLLNAYAAQQFQTRLDAIAAKKQALSQTQEPAEHKKLTQELRALQRRTLMSLPQYQALLLSRAKRFLDVAPLKSRNAQYQFIHKSLWEYAMANGIHCKLSHPIEQTSTIIASGLVPNFILQDASVLELLQNLTTPDDLRHWEDWLYASRENLEVSSVAACAITALNGLQRPLPKNLRGIRIRGADLRNAWLNNSDCREADFREVLLNGSCLNGVQFQKTRLQDIQLGQFPYLKLGRTSISAIAYHPSEPLIAVAVYYNIALHNTHTQEIIHTLQGHTDTVNTLAFSPDGFLLASGSNDCTLRLWDPLKGISKTELKGHTDTVNTLAFSPDGFLLASGSNDCTLRLWDPLKGISKTELKGHTDTVNTLAFSPDGKTLASGGHKIHLWNVQNGSLKLTLPGSTLAFSLAFSPDSRTLASGSGDNTLLLWDAQSGILKATMEGHTSRVTKIAFSPNGNIIASAGQHDSILRLWEPQNATLKATLKGHADWVMALAFNPDGSILASGDIREGTIRFWNIQSLTSRSILGHTDEVMSVAFSRDGRTLASASKDNTIRLWNVQTGTPRATLKFHTSEVNTVTFSPDGRTLASGSSDRTLLLWDFQSGTLRATLKGHTSHLTTVAFSPEGGTLVSGAAWDKTLCIWDTQSGILKATQYPMTDPVSAIAFSPDGSMLASSGWGKTVRLWDVQSGALRGTLKGHSSRIYSIAFSPDGKTLASGSNDRTLRLWDPLSGVGRATLQGHTGGVNTLAFSPDGRLLASGSEDKSIRLWDPLNHTCTQTILFQSSIISLAFSVFERQLSVAFENGFQIYKPISSQDLLYQLSWCAMASSTLQAQDCDLTNAEGLTKTQYAVLKQLGAIGESSILEEPIIIHTRAQVPNENAAQPVKDKLEPKGEFVGTNSPTLTLLRDLQNQRLSQPPLILSDEQVKLEMEDSELLSKNPDKLAEPLLYSTFRPTHEIEHKSCYCKCAIL